jgi:hypothetical protein
MLIDPEVASHWLTVPCQRHSRLGARAHVPVGSLAKSAPSKHHNQVADYSIDASCQPMRSRLGDPHWSGQAVNKIMGPLPRYISRGTSTKILAFLLFKS